MGNLRKHRDIKLVKTEKEGIISYQSKTQNYDTPKFYFKNLLPIEIKKKQILTNKPVHLGLLISELSKIVMYGFLYDYVKPKYGEKQNCVIWIQTVSSHT